MKRTTFGFFAVAVAFMVVFTPRPEAIGRAADGNPQATTLVAQMLAPSFDAIDVKNRNAANAARILSPILLMGLVTALVVTPRALIILAIVSSDFWHRFHFSLDTRSGRAPPLSLS